MIGLGHGEKLTRKQDQAIAALLSEPSIKAAAESCGVGEATLYRWLQLPNFAVAYRAARRQVVERAIGGLQNACDEAVKTLKRNLACDAPAVEIRAAQIILEQGIKGIEIMDLQERVERLESLLETQEKGKARKWA